MKNNTPKRLLFRIVVGRKYCSLTNRFHPRGTPYPDADATTAHVFKRKILALNAIKRLYDARSMVEGSLIAGSPALSHLNFEGTPDVEEFEPALT